MQTVAEIRVLLQQAGRDEYAVLERALAADPRKGVAAALGAARRRLDAEEAEAARIAELYRFQREMGGAGLVLGLDEAGRGPLAGPLAVGGAVLPDEPHIPGLNDSKQVPEARRPDVEAQVKEHALAWTVQFVEPAQIDELGMAACLRRAFTAAIRAIEAQGVRPDCILLDGVPLHLDPRERSVVKGDARCAAISAASILAKTARDRLMEGYAREYPGYGFEQNKGYGSAAHIEAIGRLGLSPIHRRSFCHFTEQPSLF